jgi:hypothetical protein
MKLTFRLCLPTGTLSNRKLPFSSVDVPLTGSELRSNTLAPGRGSEVALSTTTPRTTCVNLSCPSLKKAIRTNNITAKSLQFFVGMYYFDLQFTNKSGEIIWCDPERKGLFSCRHENRHITQQQPFTALQNVKFHSLALHILCFGITPHRVGGICAEIIIHHRRSLGHGDPGRL